MSLRLRLTLLYTTLLVGILLVFGGLVYWLVNVALLDQVDTDLTQNASRIVEMLRVNENSQFDVRSIATFRSSDNLEFQIWNASGILVVARPLPRTVALDEQTLRATQPVFTTNRVENTRLRVLTVPLVTGRGQVGTLQLGIHLGLIDLLMRTLENLLIVNAVLATSVASRWIWLVNGRALAPLATMSRVATQISHAEDLSRRIPQVGATPGDEVDQLIQTFNETLERLEQLFITQRRFLADVSHELRTPLTVIKGNVGLMRKIGEADEESLGSIEGEVDRLTRMVGDLLLLAQAESGRLPLAAEPVELDTVLLEVFQQMRLLAGERIQLHVSEIDQVQVTGDRDRLKQVLLNLVGNAVQYTPAGGLVTLSLRKTDTQARLTVTDSGPGIAAQDLPHIFERFYRGEKSRKRAPGTGFGQGRSNAYWIERSPQGTIEVRSKEGQGTEFTIYLPLKPVSAAPRNA
jgi:signal transduction histidine kinase